MRFPELIEGIAAVPGGRRFYRVGGAMNMPLEVGGLPRALAIGGHSRLPAGRRRRLKSRGFRAGRRAPAA